MVAVGCWFAVSEGAGSLCVASVGVPAVVGGGLLCIVQVSGCVGLSVRPMAVLLCAVRVSDAVGVGAVCGTVTVDHSSYCLLVW